MNRCPKIRQSIYQMVDSIKPFDEVEQEHIDFVKSWITSGAELFRFEKPNRPNIHLVSYFVVLDNQRKKCLLVDHKKASLWLPTGGHVEIDEHPEDTVKREIVEELDIEADFLFAEPFFLTLTKTIGDRVPHTDVSFWYVLKGDSCKCLNYDKEEFHQICWFDWDSIPYEHSDPCMDRFVQKMSPYL